MLPFTGFRDYYVEVYRNDACIVTLDAVTSLAFVRLQLDIKRRYRDWTHMMVYHRATRTFIGRYSRDGLFPAKPMI